MLLSREELALVDAVASSHSEAHSLV